MRRIILLWILIICPLFLYAQTAGGNVTRPANKTNKEHQTNVHNQQNDKAVSQTSRDIIIKNLMNNMVYVEGGVVTLKKCNWTGGRDSFKEESLSSFSICKYEVTQEEWTAVMGSNPSYKIGEDMPVENVSWDDCQEFIQKLNEISGKNYRLPTEAEWEFAARGGKRSKHYRYAGSNKLDEVAWTHNNSGDSLHAVGMKSPNELGLYDMSGNVLEWCQDYYGDYSEMDQVDPQGAKSGENRVCRGGGYGNAKQSRISYRQDLIPTDKYADVGFRLAESLENTQN